MAKFFKIGHRGAAGHAPENTLLSFARALEQGVDIIELDVRCLADNEVVVFHDKKIDKSGLKIDLSKMNLAEIKEIRINGQEIPTLQEALDLINRKSQVNIELKKGSADRVAEIIKEYIDQGGWSSDDFIVSCFGFRELRRFQRKNLKIRLGFLFCRRIFNLLFLSKRLGLCFIGPNYKIISQKMILSAHRENLKVFAWTVNDSEKINQLKSWGIDGIFSDYPDRL
jgi:glycerophosphoryl diester phosphodiesterase